MEGHNEHLLTDEARTVVLIQGGYGSRSSTPNVGSGPNQYRECGTTRLMCFPSKLLYFENSGWTLASQFRFLIQCMAEGARIGLSFSKASAATPFRFF